MFSFQCPCGTFFWTGPDNRRNTRKFKLLHFIHANRKQSNNFPLSIGNLTDARIRNSNRLLSSCLSIILFIYPLFNRGRLGLWRREYKLRLYFTYVSYDHFLTRIHIKIFQSAESKKSNKIKCPVLLQYLFSI